MNTVHKTQPRKTCYTQGKRIRGRRARNGGKKEKGRKGKKRRKGRRGREGEKKRDRNGIGLGPGKALI